MADLMLQEGRFAIIQSLQSRPELNGTVVILGTFLQASDRWETRGYRDSDREMALRPANLRPFPSLEHGSLARQLFHYLESSESSPHTRWHLEAHGNELPLLFFCTYKALAAKLPDNGHARLAALQAAVREVPTLELCRSDTCVRRAIMMPPTNLTASDAVTVVYVPAAAGALPAPRALPGHVSYLHTFAETLGAPTVEVLQVQKTNGQRPALPLLYAALDPMGEPNALASALCGCAVRGDAILSSAELVQRDDGGAAADSIGDGAGEEPPLALVSKKAVGLIDFEARLAKRCGGAVGFVCSKHTFDPGKRGAPPLLVGSWDVPRPAAWDRTWPAKSGLEEFLTYTRLQNVVRVSSRMQYPPQGGGGDGDVEMGPFVGRVELDLDHWPEDTPLPAAAGVLEAEPCAKKKDAVNAVAVALLRAMHAAAPAAPPLTIVEVRRPLTTSAATPADAPAAADAAVAAYGEPGGEDDEVHEDGSLIECTYRLVMLTAAPAEGAAAPLWPTAADASTSAEDELPAGGVLLEARSRHRVLLGGRVVAPTLEEMLGEMHAGTRAAAYVNFVYHGVERWGLLQAAVLGVEPPLDEVATLAHAAGRAAADAAAAGMSHGQERMTKVQELVEGLGAASLADVGCGEGKLLLRLIGSTAGAHRPARLVGIDPSPHGRVLRRAATKLREAREAALAAAAAVGGEGTPPPDVSLLRGSLAALRLTPRCDVITLVEVVEHLDPPELALVGEVLLGRAAPRALILTTPNKEYNLNYIVDPTTPGQQTLVPPVSSYPLRNPDHRFEWTRAELRQWAEPLAAQFGYTVRFDGVGGGPLDEPAVHGVWHGPGPITQIAIFERVAPMPGADHAEPEAQAGADGAEPLEVAWSSEA